MVAKKRKKSNKATLLAILMLLVGVGVMAYPTLSNWWNKLHSSQTISAYSRYVEEIDEQQASILFARAEEYNLHIPERKLLYAPSREEKKLYPTLLNLNESGIMGYIEIPKIDVYVPIYHGTDAQTLKKAIGHIEWSALPVGGLGSHSVLSGHRGLPKAKLFTDLDKIQEGDEFVITVLNRKMTYKVDQIRIVLPSELSELQPIPNKDLCTLVTCTPYGVNTHRLLVRGVRIDEEIMTPQEVHLRANAYRIPKYYALAAVLIPILFVALAVALRILGKKIREFRKRHMERAQHGKHLSLEADRENDSKRKNQKEGIIMQASISKKNKFKHVLRTFILVLLFILLAETESCQPDTAWGEVPYELCSVTFLPGGADLMDDLQKADVILDIYQVASLLQESTLLEFQYQVLQSFDNVDLSNIESKDDWITAAATALDNIIADTNNAIVPVTYDADGTYTMNAGVYLIVPHSRSLTDKREYLQEITDDAGDSYYVSIASTDDCDYLYTPQMLVIPNLIQDQNGHIEWNDQLTIVLKPNPFYHTGDLIIIKNTEGFQSSDAQTFVFQVEAYLTENEKAEHVFSDTVSAQIAGNGQQTIEILKRIPVGAEVTVTEIYHGANAKPKNGVSERQTVIQQDIPAVVEFTNIPTDTHAEENVIVNTFQFSSTEGWNLIEPAQDP